MQESYDALAAEYVERVSGELDGKPLDRGLLEEIAHPGDESDLTGALYSLIHFDDLELGTALSEIRRVLLPGGLVLVGFHRGSEIVHVDEMLGRAVDLDFRFFEPDQITTALSAGHDR